MPRVVLCGALGRMGQTLAALLRENGDFQVVAGIDRFEKHDAEAAPLNLPRVLNTEHAAEAIADCDVVIDFSAPEATAALLQQYGAALQGKAVVVGTTGHSAETLDAIAALARNAAVIVSANYSIGVNLMLGVVSAAARVLPADRYDVEIIEAHHRHKADAPSGTALLLGRTVADARGVRLEDLRRDGRSGKTGERGLGEIAFHSLRGGEVVGEHRVLFVGAHERFEITHAAADRGLFAEGALLAAAWLAGKPAGSYSMQDVLGL